MRRPAEQWSPKVLDWASLPANGPLELTRAGPHRTRVILEQLMCSCRWDTVTGAETVREKRCSGSSEWPGGTYCGDPRGPERLDQGSRGMQR